jgi:hypothetical protein
MIYVIKISKEVNKGTGRPELIHTYARLETHWYKANEWRIDRAATWYIGNKGLNQTGTWRFDRLSASAIRATGYDASGIKLLLSEDQKGAAILYTTQYPLTAASNGDAQLFDAIGVYAPAHAFWSVVEIR